MNSHELHESGYRWESGPFVLPEGHVVIPEVHVVGT